MTTRALTLPRTLTRSVRADPGVVGAWTLGFALLTYVGLKGGGYDVVIRSQIGIVVWWLVALGAVTGVVGSRRLSTPLLAAMIAFTAFTAWSLLSATWSESSERAISEAGRDVTLLGVFVLASAAVRRSGARAKASDEASAGAHPRALVHGLLAGIVLVAGLACFSRLDPSGAGTSQTGEFLPNVASRLSYGLNYWNALAVFAAMGVPLALAVAVDARTVAGRALANAAVPLLALTVFLTLSRGGMVAGGLGLVVGLALTRHRVRWLGSAALGAAGAAILIEATVQRDAVRQGLSTAVAHHEGSELIAVVVVVLAGVALVHAGASLARTAWASESPATSRSISRHQQAGVLASVVVIVVAVFFAIGGPHRISHGWESFKNPQVTHVNSDASRLGSASGEGRYQFWQSAVNAFDTDPVRGIGGGSFQTWWERHGTIQGHIVNAHSLYVETLSELGIVGLLLLVVALGLVLVTGAYRALAGPLRDRALLAGVTASCVVFVTAAAVDWMWQVTVLPIAFMLLAAVALSGPSTRETSPRRGLLRRGTLIGLALLSLAVLVPVLASASQLRQSQQAAAAGKLSPALSHAASATDVQPYAFSPRLQRALVLEAQGNLPAAAVAAADAERREPTNWAAPFVLARIDAEQGNTKAALAAFRRAKALNKTATFLR